MVKLDSNDPRSPLVVLQEGYAPGDATCQMRLFYLQHDGQWIDEIARGTRPDSEAGDVVFESSAEAMQTLSGMFGKPMVRHVPVTEADIKAHLTRMRSIASVEDAFRAFLARYRAARGR